MNEKVLKETLRTLEQFYSDTPMRNSEFALSVSSSARVQFTGPITKDTIGSLIEQLRRYQKMIGNEPSLGDLLKNIGDAVENTPVHSKETD